jgi:flavin-dependent dehydrogenase
VTDILRDKERGRGVSVLRSDGTRTEMHADVVIGADGLRSVVARRLGVAHTAVWPRRISVVAHYRGVRDVDEYGEMHIERDGFVGIADVGAGVTTVAAVFPVRRAREISGDRGGFLDRWLASKRHLAPRFAAATRDAQAAAVGPFASHARCAAMPGALLVGDAADFFDPFTGEGIYSALRGGELVADTALELLGAECQSRTDVALALYDRRRRQEFRGKWWVERLIGIGVASTVISNRATRALAGKKQLADLLVGVTGDFVPPGRVLGLGYLAQLFLMPIPDSSPRPASARTAWQ